MDVALVSKAKAALDELAATDFGQCDRAGLDAAMAKWRTVQGVNDAFRIAIGRRGRQLAAEGRSECAEDVLSDHGRCSTRDARAAAEREQACAAMPTFEHAVATGSVSSGHVDALAAAAHGLSDTARAEFESHADTLRRHAETHGVDDFTRECRNLARLVAGDDGESRLAEQRRQRHVKRWVDKVTGMHHLHAALDPEASAKLNSALDAATRARRHHERFPGAGDAPDSQLPTWDQDCADALIELVTGARTVDRRVPDVAVHVDLRTLLDGLHEHSLCETSDGTRLPVSTVRRLCCEAEIFPVVLNGDGAVLDAGRSQRLANREQRRALRAMYRTCGHDGCDVPFDQCEIHHVVPWERLGPTDLANLLPLCAFHHHMVHEGGWSLQLQADRTITLTRPDGTVHFHGSTIDRTNPRHGVPPPELALAGARAGPPADGRADRPPERSPPD